MKRIFSVRQERVVNSDNTVQLANRNLQIEKTKWRGTLAKCRVLVCTHLDGTMSVYYGPHLVGRYPASIQSQATDLSAAEPAPPAGFAGLPAAAPQASGISTSGQITC